MMRPLSAIVAVLLIAVKAIHGPMPKDLVAPSPMLELQLKRWFETRL